jgi:chromosome partitioning protein
MARVIAIANNKGGVGKTTTTVSLGAALAERERRVLLVDLDAQQNLCASVRAPRRRPGLADVLFTAVVFDTGELSEALVDACGMTVVGGYDLEYAETRLSHYSKSERALESALAPQLHRFDYVLIDCCPSVSYLTICALAAADEVLVPIQTEFLALNQLPGILSTVEDVRARLNPTLEVSGFVPTMYDGRTRHSLEVLEQITAQANLFGVRAFEPIPKTIQLAEATASGQPISTYAPKSPAALAYRSIADEIDRHDRTGLVNDTDYDSLFLLNGSLVDLREYAPASVA